MEPLRELEQQEAGECYMIEGLAIFTLQILLSKRARWEAMRITYEIFTDSAEAKNFSDLDVD